VKIDNVEHLTVMFYQCLSSIKTVCILL